VVVEEGGAAGISPRVFGRLVLPHLRALLADKPCPMILSFVGGTVDFLDFLLACSPDGVRVDGQCDITLVRAKVPQDLPLFTGCGVSNLLAEQDPESIRRLVHHRLDGGATSVSPPADIYPAAKPENITAFVEALRQYPD
jgi:uroporphyrinogen-III decarboxylase